MTSKKQKVLIIDDDQLNIQAISPLLDEMNIAISTLYDGHNALEKVQNIQPDLILLDIMMPEISGLEVCTSLKEDKTTQHIPIIFITAKTKTEDIVQGFKLGGADYICKPFKKQEFQARVRTHLKLQEETQQRKAREVELKKTVTQLQKVIKENKILKELLPLCSQCKKIRDDEGYWKQIDEYFAQHSDVQFSHSLCPHCAIELYPDMAQKIIDRIDAKNNL
jgi:DNA-binding response OmpR family regulator